MPLQASHTYTTNSLFYTALSLRDKLLANGYFVFGMMGTEWPVSNQPPSPDPESKQIQQPAVYIRPLATEILLAARSQGTPATEGIAYRQQNILGSSWYVYDDPDLYLTEDGLPGVPATNVYVSCTLSLSLLQSIGSSATSFRTVGLAMSPVFEEPDPGQTVFPYTQVTKPGSLLCLCNTQAQPLIVNTTPHNIKTQVII